MEFPDRDQTEIAATAARLIVEEGLEYGPAKQRALKALGLPGRTRLPGNDLVEDQVRDYLALFCADTQPAELAVLRGLAATWMERLAEFRPHLAGAAWRGTATRLSALHLQLFCDDPKSAEIALLNLGVAYAPGPAPAGAEDALWLDLPCRELGSPVPMCLAIFDFDALRGALKPDSRGRTERGDLAALRRLMEQEEGSKT